MAKDQSVFRGHEAGAGGAGEETAGDPTEPSAASA